MTRRTPAGAPRRRPAGLYLLVALMVLQGLSGGIGGAALVADPSGGLLRMPLTLLEGSPFTSFLVPGLVLLTLLGVLPLGVAGSPARFAAAPGW